MLYINYKQSKTKTQIISDTLLNVKTVEVLSGFCLSGDIYPLSFLRRGTKKQQIQLEPSPREDC